MSDMLSAGAAALVAGLQASASVPVTYVRGSYSLTLNATTGRSLLKITEASGAVKITRTDLDLIVPAALMVDADGNLIEPTRGDLVQRLWPDGVTRQYSVMPYGPDEPLFRYSDPARCIMRIHCKFQAIVG
jgi:hypothetical protein